MTAPTCSHVKEHLHTSCKQLRMFCKSLNIMYSIEICEYIANAINIYIQSWNYNCSVAVIVYRLEYNSPCTVETDMFMLLLQKGKFTI